MTTYQDERTPLNELETLSSGGNSLLSSRWHGWVKRSISKYDFILIDGKYSPGCKCEFCGANIRYVAEIKGNALPGHLLDGETVTYKIGFDCLELALGSDWAHHNTAERILKGLKEKVKRERNLKKYREEYAPQIDWLKKISPLTKNGYIHHMLECMTTGKTASKRVIADMLDFYEKEHWSYEHLSARAAAKEGTLKKLTEGFDAYSGNFTDSEYSFYNNVYNWFKQYGRISEKQEQRIDEIISRAKKRVEDSSKENSELGNLLQKIPF